MIKTDKTYLVINNSASPVCIQTRFEGYMVAGKQGGIPGTLPLTIDEIQQVNNNSNVFKIGALRFEKEHEKDIYNVLRIADWRDIMTEEEIDEAITTASYESLKKILDIKDPMYFDRIYGEYIGLRNAGFPISGKVQDVMDVRRRELMQKKYTTGIVLKKKDVEENEVKREDYDALKAELEELKALIAAQADRNKSTPKEKTAGAAKGTAKKTAQK